MPRPARLSFSVSSNSRPARARRHECKTRCGRKRRLECKDRHECSRRQQHRREKCEGHWAWDKCAPEVVRLGDVNAWART
eukprot:353893-Chlamydomonas_euryale.AAC.3